MDDDLGAPLTLTTPPARVVSLVPSLTEAVAATGLLVGVTDYCTHPADLSVARVGGTKWPVDGRGPRAPSGPRARQRGGEPPRGCRGAASRGRGRMGHLPADARRSPRLPGPRVRRSRRHRATMAGHGQDGVAAPRLDRARPCRHPGLAPAMGRGRLGHVRGRRTRSARRDERVRRRGRTVIRGRASTTFVPRSPISWCSPTNLMPSPPTTVQSASPACGPRSSPADTSPGTAHRSSRRGRCWSANSAVRAPTPPLEGVLRAWERAVAYVVGVRLRGLGEHRGDLRVALDEPRHLACRGARPCPATRAPGRRVSGPAPMPIVGIGSSWVTRLATSPGTISSTTANAPASVTARASASTSSAASPRPCTR